MCKKALGTERENNYVRFKWMIGDGDSKSYNAIWNVYGACDTCHKHEAVGQSDKELNTRKNLSGALDMGTRPLQGKAECESDKIGLHWACP